MNRDGAIGVFDSGVGGLTLVKALHHELPKESIIYLADSANAPYGNLFPERITELSAENTRFLLGKGVKLIVVACNTATGAAIKHLRSSFPVPFVGMEPAIKPAAAISKTKKIGVLATARTFEADHFNNTLTRFTDKVEVVVKVGDGLVELIEEGKMESCETEVLLRTYIEPLLQAGIDQLVLGCTHYPFLIPLLRRILPPDIMIHDPAPAVARQTRRILEEMGSITTAQKKRQDEFHSSGDPAVLNSLVSSYLYQPE